MNSGDIKMAQFGKYRLGLMIAACVALTGQGFAQGYKTHPVYPKVHREIEDKKFELIETGLEFWRFGTGSTSYDSNLAYGFWLSEKLLVISVMAEEPDAFKKKLERIMLVDVTTGKSDVLIKQGSLGSIGCRNKKYQIMAYLPFNISYYKSLPPDTLDSRAQRLRRIEEDTRYVRVDEQGNVSALTGPAPIKSNCDPIDYSVPSHGSESLLREGDGYIDRSENDYDFEKCTRGKARLIRPGKPPLELGIENAEISERFPAYLPYYDKYQLTMHDHRGKSGTDASTAGCTFKHPYSYSPYRVMSRDGVIEEVPYPEIIFDFGLRGFGNLWVTPQGLLIETSGVGVGRSMPFDGLLLLKGERMFRLWGGNGWFSRGGREATHVLNISPDGCRVVFTHSTWSSYPGSHPLSILNLCKEQ